MKIFPWLKSVCEYFQGCEEQPPAGLGWLSSGWARGLWWAFLLGVIIVFCGQTSKFIYIDF